MVLKSLALNSWPHQGHEIGVCEAPHLIEVVHFGSGELSQSIARGINFLNQVLDIFAGQLGWQYPLGICSFVARLVKQDRIHLFLARTGPALRRCLLAWLGA